MTDRYKSLVAQGYDLVAERYLEWPGGAGVRQLYLEKFLQLVPRGGRALDLGCGAGIPVVRELSSRAEVIGVDLSQAQLALARRHAPNAHFIRGDMARLEFQPEVFDAVSAFFSITHVPREEHAALLLRIRSWLRKDGVFLASLGAEEAPEIVEADWLGTPMFFSHFDAAANAALVRAAGFRLFHQAVVEHDEDGRPTRFLWVIARKA